MMFAQTKVEAPKYGASSREAEISVDRVPPPTTNATRPNSSVDASSRTRAGASAALATSPVYEGLLVVLVVVGRVPRLVGRNRDLLGRDLTRDDRDVDLVLVLAVDEDGRAGLERAAEDEVGQRILDEALDRPAERPGAHRRVVTLLDEELFGRLGELDRGLVLANLVAQPLHQQLDDQHDLVLRQLVEDDHLVDPVQQLRPEDLLQLAHDPVLHLLVGEARVVADGEAEGLVLRDRRGADVRRHDHD